MKARFRLTHIERYVMVRTLAGVGVALAVLTAVIMLIDFVELSRTVGVRSREVSVLDVFGLALLESPSVILLLLPFAFLFGVLGAFVNLNRRNELVAMRAAGISAWRFILPAAGAAVAIGVVTILALNPIASVMNARYQKLQATMSEGYVPDATKAIWLRQGDGHTQIIIRAEGRLPGAPVRLKQVSLFVYDIDDHGALRFARRIDADEASLQHGQWRLKGAREATAGSEAVRYDTLSIPSTLDERTALDRFARAQAVPFWNLPEIIRTTEGAGFSATTYRLQFQQLLATPMLFAAISILAAAFSLRLLRLGGLAGLAGAGVALGFVVFFLNQFCMALGRADVLPPFIAAWTPPTLALLAGFTLLCYTEDG